MTLDDEDYKFFIGFVLDVDFLEEPFRAKEIGLTSPYHTVSFSFKPPRPWTELTEEEQLEYTSTHTVPWEAGKIDYCEIKNVFHLYRPIGFIYAKGKVKCDFFRSIFGCTVHDLEAMDCPDASALQHLIIPEDDKENRPTCPNFPQLLQHYETCAAINSQIYLKWLTNKIREEPDFQPLPWVDKNRRLTLM